MCETIYIDKGTIWFPHIFSGEEVSAVVGDEVRVVAVSAYDSMVHEIGYAVRGSSGRFVFGRSHGPARINFKNGIINFVHMRVLYIHTRNYCEDVGMSGEETLMWVLRFGERLPDTIEGFYGESWESMPLEEF